MDIQYHIKFNFVDKILKYIDAEIKIFCNANPNYIFFRIGSSLFPHEIKFNDIDYLIFDTRSEIDYRSEIDNLYEQFSTDQFIKSSIKTFDKEIDKLFCRIENQISLMFKIQTIHLFGFGPVSTIKDCITLHLAGPMNYKSSNYFFSKFPMFYLIYSKFNRKLTKVSFEDLFTAPQFGIFEYNQSINKIVRRSENTTLFEVKLQCLKRIILIDLTFNNHNHPYLEAYNRIKNLDRNKIIVELENYKKE